MIESSPCGSFLQLQSTSLCWCAFDLIQYNNSGQSCMACIFDYDWLAGKVRSCGVSNSLPPLCWDHVVCHVCMSRSRSEFRSNNNSFGISATRNKWTVFRKILNHTYNSEKVRYWHMKTWAEICGRGWRGVYLPAGAGAVCKNGKKRIQCVPHLCWCRPMRSLKYGAHDSGSGGDWHRPGSDQIRSRSIPVAECQSERYSDDAFKSLASPTSPSPQM
jgi:hypothetical protein